jgi:hypothetical protein
MTDASAKERAYDAWEHICDDAFDCPKKGVIALFTVYLDASHNRPSPTRPNPPLIHSVGGYLARKTDWDKFRKEWRLELAKKNVPHFHMKDFEYAQAAIRRGERDRIGRKNPFKDWSEEEFLPFINRLYRTINRKRKDSSYRVVAFTSSVVMDEFDETLPDELKDDPECRSHYIFNVANIMKMIGFRHSGQAIYEPVHYVLAGGDGEGGNLERWFDYCMRTESSRQFYRLVKGYTRLGYDIQWMKDEPALQAADIAAYEFNKVAIKVTENPTANIPLDEMRKSLPILCRAEHFSFTLTGSELAAAFAQIIVRRKFERQQEEREQSS